MYLTLDKVKLSGNSFIDSQSNYAALLWMLYHKAVCLNMQSFMINLWKPSVWRLLLRLGNKLSLHQRHMVFINVNILKCCFLEYPVYIILLQIQTGWMGPVLFAPFGRSTIKQISNIKKCKCLYKVFEDTALAFLQ